MKRTALIAVLLPIALAAIAGPIWAVMAVDRNAARVPSFQLLANASCACERRAGDTRIQAACWQRFERLTGTDHKHPTGGTTCDPLSEATVQVGEGTENGIILRYNVNASQSGLYLCSRDEAVAGEAIWYGEIKVSHPASVAEFNQVSLRANRALIRFAEALKRGEPLAKLKPSFGCTVGRLP